MEYKKVINYYKNFYEVSKKLSQKQFYEFNMAIFQVMFYEKHIKDVSFKDPLNEIVWESVKHSIKASLDGFCNKKGVGYEILLEEVNDALSKGLSNNGNVNEKGNENENVKENVNVNEKGNVKENDNEKKKKKPKSQCITDMSDEKYKDLEATLLNYCDENNIDRAELQGFIDYCQAHHKPYVNHLSAFKNWCRNSQKWGGK